MHVWAMSPPKISCANMCLVCKEKWSVHGMCKAFSLFRETKERLKMDGGEHQQQSNTLKVHLFHSEIEINRQT